MAKIVEDTIIVKISKLVRSGDENATLVNQDVLAGIEAMTTELIQDPAALVEVWSAEADNNE